MNRRSFLKAMAGAVAAPFVVPELIVPERRVFALDQTMVPGLEVPQFKPWLQLCVDRFEPGPDGGYGVIANWASDSKRGVFLPGHVITSNPDARVVFLRQGEFIQPHIGSHYPKGMGVPAWDQRAIQDEYLRLRFS